MSEPNNVVDESGVLRYTIDYVVEYLNDAGEWDQLDSASGVEADGRRVLQTWRSQNPTRIFRLIERVTQTRVIQL